MSLAILIVTFDGSAYVAPLFASLAEHTDLTDVEIIVVDNASRDGTLTEVRKATEGWPRVHVLPQAENSGFAGGNNVGLQEARRLGVEYVLLLNQDIEVTPGWLDPLREVMARRPDVAAAQPLLFLHAEPELLNTSGNELHFCGFGYCGAYRRRPSAELMSAPVHPVAFCSGAALMLRMSMLDRVGDLDERLFMYHEDTDLQLRLRARGYDCVVVTTSAVRHKYTGGFSPRKFALLERNRWIVLLKHWPTARLLAIAPALLGVEVAVLVMAARGGWLRDKLRTYGELVRAWPSIRQDRRQWAERRDARANDADVLTGELRFEGFDHPLVTRVANPVLGAYWRLVKRVVS